MPNRPTPPSHAGSSRSVHRTTARPPQCHSDAVSWHQSHPRLQTWVSLISSRSGGLKLKFHGDMTGLNKPAAFEALCRPAAWIKWVVFVKPPFGGPEQVLKYLARYTHRVAISNSRILSIEDGKVMFRWKNYADGNKTRMMTLDAVEFIRRFLLHI